jgi:hypothetical protein
MGWIIFLGATGYFLFAVWGLLVGALVGAFWLVVAAEARRVERRLSEGWSYTYDPGTGRVTWRRP